MNSEVATNEKQEWVKPEVARFSAGSAESQAGPNGDGGGGAQGS